jgi:archaellum component FlaC
MDIDERLERLTQRHEALTQTVELLTKDLSDMKVLVNDIAEGTARLLHVAEIREKRISRLEDAKS